MATTNNHSVRQPVSGVLKQVHHIDIDVRRQVALLPEGDALAVGARVVAHLFVDRAAVAPHDGRCDEATAAVPALVIAPLLVDRLAEE